MFIPVLWSSIDTSTPSWEYILRGCADPKTTHPQPYLLDPARVKESDEGKDQEWVRAVFWKYGRHIRKLIVHWPMVLEAVSIAASASSDGSGGGGCNGIRSLTLAFGEGRAQGPYEIDFEYETRLMIVQSTVEWPQPSPDSREMEATVSEPLFPGFVGVEDLKPPRPFFEVTDKSRKELLEYGWVLAQHYWHTILSNPGLRQLVMENPSHCQWRPRSKDVFLKLVGGLKELQELKTDIPDFWDTTDIWRILQACPRVRSLDVSAVGQFRFPDPLPEATNTTLVTLSSAAGISVKSLLMLCHFFPNLSTLKMTSVGIPASVNTFMGTTLVPEQNLPPIANLSDVCDSLKSLFALTKEYNSIFRCLPNLTELIQQEGFDERMTLALTTHCPRFEVFRSTTQPWYIDESERGSEDPTNQFLVDTTTLRVFDSIRHFIQVDEMLRQPWACLGLEWLTCRIVGVDRLTHEEQAIVDRVQASPGSSTTAPGLMAEETAAIEKFHRCRRQHHGVYDQLARLIRLKHLDLGYESRNPWTGDSADWYEVDGERRISYPCPTFDTLELSLESGLDRLATLTRLEMFGFECVNQRIGRKELEWMARCWPRLELMYGLDKERLIDIEPDRKRAALREYFQQLRPEVVHDSLFINDV